MQLVAMKSTTFLSARLLAAAPDTERSRALGSNLRPLVMKKILNYSYLVLSVIFTSLGAEVPAHAVEPPGSTLTFCNPLNIDYELKSDSRTGADPVIVLFKEKYYLFSTWDKPGMRVSDDLVHWRYLAFPQESLALMTDDQNTYQAAAAAVHGDWLYFINMSPRKELKGRNQIMRTRDPLKGGWEKCGETRSTMDPCLFWDDDSRVYLYYGLGSPSQVFELDSKTFTEIPDSKCTLMPPIPKPDQLDNGFELGRRELDALLDTGSLKGKFTWQPCQEGAWMTKYHGKYYLQIATPGTVCNWYCDNLLVGPTPVGPFTQADYAPVSMKVGGFVGSAGHSCLFQDKNGNWWRATTQWIGIPGRFTRRLGLFPAGFDSQDRMFTQTTLGDYPQIMPREKRPVDWARVGDNPYPANLAGWQLLSFGKSASASSAAPEHGVELATDENIRSWWSAESGKPGEWFQVDLGGVRDIRAIQVNFADEPLQPGASTKDDYHAYKLLASSDGAEWHLIVDRSANRVAAPHDYTELATPAQARFVKVENVHVPSSVKFALSDLRVFGNGQGRPPSPVQEFKAERHADDSRYVTFTWKPSQGVDGYLIHYGPSPDALFQTVQVQGGAEHQLTIHALMRNVHYTYRIDCFNENGVASGAQRTDPKKTN